MRVDVPESGPGEAHAPTSTAGVLPFQDLAKAAAAGWIAAPSFDDSQLQPASVDLRLGEVAYRLRCSFLPDRGSTVAQKLDAFAIDEIALGEGALLERNAPYLIPLQEELSLPEHVRGKANPKSSAGRVDIFTRVLTDRHARFDEIPPGYEGGLYLEIAPRSFMVRVKTGLSLNQLRLIIGDPGQSRCPDSSLSELQLAAETKILYLDGKAVPPSDLSLSEGLFMSVDLRGGDDGLLGFRARTNSRPIDLSSVAEYAWQDYWEPLVPETGDRLILEPEAFYLLLSRESVVIPPDLAGEMAAYDPTAGELRTHYAGFFDPGFGFRSGSKTEQGSRATLEVRARDVPFAVEHGQPISKLVFERLVKPAAMLYGAEIGSSYQGQRVTLSKHFSSQGEVGQQLALAGAARVPRAGH